MLRTSAPLIGALGITMRRFAAWLVGVAVFLAIGVGIALVGDTVGLISSVDLDGPTSITHGSGRYSYEEEETSFLTSFGYATGVLATLIGLWAGQATCHGKLAAGFTRKGWLSFNIWVGATTILLIMSGIIQLAFNHFHRSFANYARMILELATFIGVAWPSHKLFKARAIQIDGESDA